MCVIIGLKQILFLSVQHKGKHSSHLLEIQGIFKPKLLSLLTYKCLLYVCLSSSLELGMRRLKSLFGTAFVKVVVLLCFKFLNPEHGYVLGVPG
jgi:hypothetical protein